jgi:FlaA1/EpsC-like NDP-sugar epimerase
MRDLTDLMKAVTISSVAFVVILALTGNIAVIPRSVFVLDWLVALFLCGGARFAVRAVWERWSSWFGTQTTSKPALVIGAGEATGRLLRHLRQGEDGFHVVGLLDDDRTKRGMRLHGVQVMGRLSDLASLIERHRIELLIIAIPSASPDDMKRIVNLCAGSRIEFKIVPSLRELLNGRAHINQLRKVEVEDLLGREAVRLDLSDVQNELEQRIVLVTGAAGSIGSELARQIAALAPSHLILVEQAESPLYFIDLELRKKYPGLAITPVIADITDRERLHRVFAQYKPEYVFHTAAYKHVPLMEANVSEAVRNNVFGTYYVAQAAVATGVSRFVMISTDKAVRPSSVMGATKRIAERVVLGWPEFRQSSVDFRAVRFGNVLGSDGSVIPVFRRQLAAGGPLTVTHPDVTRYFMTIPEAVQLVLQAGVLPEAAGRISMLEMGEPVRIVDLAENLVRLSGLEPYKDIPIVFTGLRPGEKLYEELMSDVEETIPTGVEKIRIVQTDEADGEALERGIDRLAAALEIDDYADLVRNIGAFVPECVPPLRTTMDKVGHRYPLRAAS